MKTFCKIFEEILEWDRMTGRPKDPRRERLELRLSNWRPGAKVYYVPGNHGGKRRCKVNGTNDDKEEGKDSKDEGKNCTIDSSEHAKDGKRIDHKRRREHLRGSESGSESGSHDNRAHEGGHGSGGGGSGWLASGRGGCSYGGGCGGGRGDRGGSFSESCNEDGATTRNWTGTGQLHVKGNCKEARTKAAPMREAAQTDSDQFRAGTAARSCPGLRSGGGQA